MKEMFASIAMAFSMFSIVPMPLVEWKKENMRYMLCFLPLVGVVIGLVLWGWLVVCQQLQFGVILYAAGLTFLPMMISGGIHMDGFCDTADALSSHAMPERKREILKDPHAGAFAVIYAACYILVYFALCTEVALDIGTVWALGIQQVLARALGALASVLFPASGHRGLLTTFRDAAQKRSVVVLVAWAALCAAALLWISPVTGAVTVILAGLCMAYVHRMSRREFGGMSGDLTGFLITISTLAMLLGTVLTERIAA